MIVILYDTQYTEYMTADKLIDGQVLELRRGIIVLVILSQLQEPRYGYGLLQQLEQAGIAIDAGTLYPLMRRLERQGVLESTWNTKEARPRKYYQLSQTGTTLYRKLLAEWQQMTTNIQAMTKGDV